MKSSLICASTGLGHYLHDVDEQHRSWDWQLRNVIIFSRAHFHRGVYAITGNHNDDSELRFRMLSLLTSESAEDYFRRCDLMIGIALIPY